MSANRRRVATEAKPKRRSMRKLFFRPRQPKRSTRAPKMRTQPEKQLGVFYLFILCLLVAGLVSISVMHLHVRFEGVRLGYETSNAREVKRKLIAQRRALRLELASLKAPQRVEEEARKRLKMEMPDQKRIIQINKKQPPALASGGAR